MRSVLLLLALAACEAGDDTEPSDAPDTEAPDDTDPDLPDTDEADTDDTDDTDPGDTDDTGDTDPPCTTVYWRDADGDGWGGAVSVVDCELPAGYAAVSGDCEDTSDRVRPDADETCDGRDEDCDGAVDDDPIDGHTYYEDADGDGHGDPSAPVAGCELPTGAAEAGDDCDVADPDIHPGARDACLDGVDADCDGADDACFPASGTYDYGLATATWTGGADENFGDWLAHGGDLDGDGTDDLLVGANGRTSSSSASRNGAMWFVYGDVALSGALTSGSHPRRDSDSRCLEDLDGVGDLDGDGYGDMAVGTTCWWYGGGAMIAYGSPTRLTGTTGGLAYDAAWQGASYTYTGGAVGGGDFDGDGYSDLMFADQTSVYVAYGGATRLSGTSTPSGLFTLQGGAYATPAGTGDGISSGDVDGDGIDDLLAYDYWTRAASGNIPGEVHLVYGDSGGWSGVLPTASADASFVGPTAASYVGMGMSNTAGDLDGDGYDEVIAASRVYDGSTGAAWVFAGSATRHAGDVDSTAAAFVVTGASTYAYFASDVVVTSDMDGDGAAELLIGSDGYGAYLFRGEAGRSGTYTSADATAGFDGAAYADGMGESVASGDFDGDGLVDIVVGSGDYSINVGKMYFFTGSSW